MEFYMGKEKVAFTPSYTYLGVTSQGHGFPYGRQPLFDFFLNMQLLVCLKDNVHIYSSKNRELNCGLRHL